MDGKKILHFGPRFLQKLQNRGVCPVFLHQTLKRIAGIGSAFKNRCDGNHDPLSAGQNLCADHISVLLKLFGAAPEAAKQFFPNAFHDGFFDLLRVSDIHRPRFQFAAKGDIFFELLQFLCK